MSSEAVRFVLGVHVHQPVGNFDHVFAQHVEDVYLPFLRALEERDTFPIALHVSGPLIEWLRDHDTRYLDAVGRLAADGKIDLLLAGCYEPVLAALTPADRVEQVEWMRALLLQTFGTAGTSLWLTERVWEPDLPRDLVSAGVTTVLVDDRHFLVSGFPREALYAPFRTEAEGRGLSLLPIDERLRYLVPFRPPADTAAYVTALRERGRRLVVFADDGEKFGGWPGTKEWVYDRGWLREFLETLDRLRAEGALQLVTTAEAVRAVPSAGLAYLPTASYREMEGWALWPHSARRLRAIETTLGDEATAGLDGALIRGTHWRNFLARYPESNRMHKKAQRLSALLRAAGDPPVARRAIGRAQCNDAYWHGVFGGLYLPHLRAAVWRELALAERALRAGTPLEHEVLDFDHDGQPEIWIHADAFSALVSPWRGGSVEEYTDLTTGVNHADVLTRRVEAYHETTVPSHEPVEASPGPASTHDMDRGLTRLDLPTTDAEPRALFQERILRPETDARALEAGTASPIRSWAARPFSWTVERDGEALLVILSPEHQPDGLRKVYRFTPAGLEAVELTWDASAGDGLWFTTELSHTGGVACTTTPEAGVWTYPIETVAKSERGLERTRQGTATVLRWPVAAGHAEVRLSTTRDEAAP